MKYIVTLIISCFTFVSYAQNFVLDTNDSSVTTEYNDGKLWAYRHSDNYIVGLTCYEHNDDYGKYYQIQIYIHNLSAQSTTFDPEDISASVINKKGDSIALQVFTNEEYQKKVQQMQGLAMALYGFAAGVNAGSAAYSTSYSTTISPNGTFYTTTHYNPAASYQANLATNLQIANMGKMMTDERITKEQGYLKITTIHPNFGIRGYMNIKRKKGSILTINIPIDSNIYSFEWDVNKNNYQ